MTATQERPAGAPPSGPDTGTKKSRFKYVAETLDGKSVKGEI